MSGSVVPDLPLSRHAHDVRRLSVGLRVPAFALLTAGLTVGGHVLAHGGAPSLPVVGGVVAASGAARLLIGTRRHSFAPLAGIMVLGQLVSHTLLSVHDDAAATASVAVSGHHHGPVDLGPATGGLHISPTMLAAHAVVALALAWWVYRGEALSEALARRLTQRLPLVVLPRIATGRPRPGAAPEIVVRSRFILTPGPGRAPPLPC